MNDLLLDVIIETINPVPSNRHRASPDGFIGKAAHSFACHLIAIEIRIEQQFVHHGEEYTMIFLYIEKDDVFEFADRLGGITIENIPSASIKNIIFNEHIVGIRIYGFHLMENPDELFFLKLIPGIDNETLKNLRVLNGHQNFSIGLTGHISIFI